MSSKEGEEVMQEAERSEVAHLNDAILAGGDQASPFSRVPEDDLYPDITDDMFLQKLLKKREFRESIQPKLTDSMLLDNTACDVNEFEYTPVQRFIAQFMSPKTPYNGMLLYHGVGVGKTCTAVITAEAFLELSPKNKVYILAPPTIQAGFYRTIFDKERIIFGDGDTPNRHEGCTGNIYLELSQMLYSNNKDEIESKVNRIIKKRYSIMGYVAFRNKILELFSRIPPSLPVEKRREQEKRLLQKELSGSLFIIDEAHNLRDVVEDEPDDTVDASTSELSDSSAGKKLTPFLRKVLKTCDGLKLLLMTATPMYNSYKEIIPLLNLLLYADHVDDSELLNDTSVQFYTPAPSEADPRPKERLTPESEVRLSKIANGRVSFMRGENPRAFPSRLDPSEDLRINAWPPLTPDGNPILPEIPPFVPAEEAQREGVLSLPLVKCDLIDDSLEVIKHLTETIVGTKGLGISTIDVLLQAGNCVYPGEGFNERIGSEGFKAWFSTRAIAGRFKDTRISTLPQYTMVEQGEDSPGYMWMARGRNLLGKYSPKINSVLKTIQNASGISFVYSRFVETGAVIFCLLLEANGYLPWGRSAPLFSKGVVTPLGGQCSKCEKRKTSHPAKDPSQPEGRENHTFSQAYYALLTASTVTIGGSDYPLCPNKDTIINTLRDKANADGSQIKVIVGSEVAGEGLDLRAIREIHILESWFHLSKEEQIVGRGIRYCSHQALERQFRNCTIHLYANVFPGSMTETIDLYSYRTAMNKAIRVGNVSRVLKQGAVDCNVNRDAILITGLSSVQMIDSQRVERKVSLNDRNFTPICDWSQCDYACKPSIAVMDLPDDSSTYDIFAARFTEQKLLSILRQLFKEKPWYHWEHLERIFKQQISKDITTTTLTGLLLRAINNPGFVLENGSVKGSLMYKNGLFLFQPFKIKDTAIPLALRWGRYPVKRDSYMPGQLRKEEAPRAVKPVKPSAPLASVAAPSVAQEQVEEEAVNQSRYSVGLKMWTDINTWIDAWTATNPIVEKISDELSTSISAFVGGDKEKRENIESRLKKLQWWGQSLLVKGLSVGGAAGDKERAEEVLDLQVVARQYVWDTFIRGKDQVILIQQNAVHKDTVANEQIVDFGGRRVIRYLDVDSGTVVYICEDGSRCDRSDAAAYRQMLLSKTDEYLQVRANQRTSAQFYGFMVPWERSTLIFKTNDKPAVEGKDPGRGLACALISTVKTHMRKLEVLGNILSDKSGSQYSLTDATLASGPRKLTGAHSYCALLEIILRWMDRRNSKYNSLRYFYRPISSYYSKHRVSKSE